MLTHAIESYLFVENKINRLLISDPASLPPLHNRIDPDIQLDTNICYFAIQCLGKLALLDRTLFMDCLDTFPLLKASECVLANGKDTSLCLHILRLFRTIGESEYV